MLPSLMYRPSAPMAVVLGKSGSSLPCSFAAMATRLGAAVVVLGTLDAGFTAVVMIVEEAIIQIKDKEEERKYREDERKYRNQVQELSGVQTNDRC